MATLLYFKPSPPSSTLLRSLTPISSRTFAAPHSRTFTTRSSSRRTSERNLINPTMPSQHSTKQGPHTIHPQNQQQRRSISAPYGYEQAKSLAYTTHGDPPSVLNLHSHSISPAHTNLTTTRMLATPINPADINTIQGVYPTKPPFTTTALSTNTPSAVPGNEGLAEVLSAGTSAYSPSTQNPTFDPASSSPNDENKLQRGDWVIMNAPVLGTFRTHMQSPSSSFLKLSDPDRSGINPLTAATVSVNPVTAWAMLSGWTTSGSDPPTASQTLNKGEWFVQNGANSSVGRAAIQLAKHLFGLKSVNIIRARPEGEEATQNLKEELKALGADAVFTEEEAAESGWSKRVVEDVTGGERVRLGLNCVGGKSALNLAKLLAATPTSTSTSSSSGSEVTKRNPATHVTYGAMAKQPLTLPASTLIFTDTSYAGFWVSAWARNNPAERVRAIREVLGLVREGMFRETGFVEIPWRWETKEEELREAFKGAMEGFRGGKGVFVFEGT
ncbi:MAG: mitochondrial 2-enoyl thioester reductase [Alyxoria varia]|nr:MAG: mitochondrial 2-enoyl thioester reductase [Alyxoria varia]